MWTKELLIDPKLKNWMAYQIGFYIRNSHSRDCLIHFLSECLLFLASNLIYSMLFLEGLVSVNKWVLIPRAGYKNVLITRYEILYYIKLKLYAIGNRQDREFLDPTNIMAKEIENSKNESTSKKLIQYSKIELSALS